MADRKDAVSRSHALKGRLMLRTVNRIPLDRLWDADGDIEASRVRWLSKPALCEMLRICPVEFYVADIGHPLQRVDRRCRQVLRFLEIGSKATCRG